VVPLYNRFDSPDFIKYPAIIAALGKLGSQTVLIIGNQPCYQIRSDGTRVKVPSNPDPSDFNYMKRMLEMGKKIKVPAVFLCDTPGAKPTLEAECADQARKIEEAIEAGINYDSPIVTLVTGLFGSGGGLACAPLVDHVAAFSNSLLCVAEPSSAAAIIKKTESPTEELIRQTIKELHMIPDEQLAAKLIDVVITEPMSGFQNDSFETMQIIRYHLAETIYGLNKLSDKRLQRRRYRRMSKLHGISLRGQK